MQLQNTKTDRGSKKHTLIIYTGVEKHRLR